MKNFYLLLWFLLFCNLHKTSIISLLIAYKLEAFKRVYEKGLGDQIKNMLQEVGVYRTQCESCQEHQDDLNAIYKYETTWVERWGGDEQC